MKYFKNLFVFDIETVPDIEAGRRLLGLENADNGEVRKALSDYHLQITDGKNDRRRGSAAHRTRRAPGAVGHAAFLRGGLRGEGGRLGI